ncbi:MAG TPA: peptidase M4 [Blastocatellia bacterium]|nr:peptidase M4 [Blastocatellia bacterium]
MAETPDGSLASTPDSVKAVAQTSEPSLADPKEVKTPVDCEGDGKLFVIGESVERAVEGRPKERDSSQPVYRPLKIFALDPSVSRLEGATAVVNVPYEPLEEGPCGSFIKVENSTAGEKSGRHLLNLDDRDILIGAGLTPSTSDERFQEQMVYAVCSVVHTAFRRALGRHVAWGFNKPADRTQLLVKPRAFQSNNSHYNRETGELCFGFYKSQAQDTYPGKVYACLSHDTVAHEVTHALLDGLRAHFSLPMSADVLAFHEGFADLVALFQHFSYEQVVRSAIRKSRGDLSRADLLTDIARQLGQSRKDSSSALRSAIDYAAQQPPAGEKRTLRVYDPALEAHDLGSVLVFAVFEAFINVFKRKTERLLRLATGGTGRLRAGEISADLQAALAEKASKLASQFLTMCIRAIDYCPPVDMTFGQYLRAVITADKDLVPDDPWAYREAWVDAFRRYKIFPPSVPDLSEESLLWLTPKQFELDVEIPRIDGLAFAELKFDGDPAWPASAGELKRQACDLGKIISKPELMALFGLTAKGDPQLKRDINLEPDEVDLPKLQSIRSSRRIGPSGQVVFDIVAEVTQLRRAHVQGSEDTCNFYGGSTIIIDPHGAIRYVIAKRVTNNLRLQQQIDFLNGPLGAKYKDSFYGQVSSQPNFFMMLHEEEAQPTQTLKDG